MTPEFLAWWELNQRKADGSAMQAAWLAWQHLTDSRAVAQSRPDLAGTEESTG